MKKITDNGIKIAYLLLGVGLFYFLYSKFYTKTKIKMDGENENFLLDQIFTSKDTIGQKNWNPVLNNNDIAVISTDIHNSIMTIFTINVGDEQKVFDNLNKITTRSDSWRIAKSFFDRYGIEVKTYLYDRMNDSQFNKLTTLINNLR